MRFDSNSLCDTNMNGQIFVDGTPLGCVSDVEMEITPEENEEELITWDATQELSFSSKVDPLDIMSLLYGQKITNNFLKTRGGVMVRRHR